MIDKSKIITKEPNYIKEDDGCISFLLHAFTKTLVAVGMLYLFYLIIK